MGQRQTYRVSGAELEGIQVWVLVGEVMQAVHLIDVSGSGAAVALPGHTSDQVRSLLRASDEPPAVLIQSDRLEAPLNVMVRVANIHNMAVGALLGRAFLRRVGEHEALDKALLRVFNRRGAVRVDANPSEPIVVRVAGPTGRELTRALLKDLSLTGIGLIVSPNIMDMVQMGSLLHLDTAGGGAGARGVGGPVQAGVRRGATRQQAHHPRGHDRAGV